MKNNEIYQIFGTDYKNMTKQLLKESDLITLIPDRNCRIGIKPNLVAPSHPSEGATTHPEIAAGIIEYLIEYGCTQIILVEGSWVGDRTEESAAVCGYDKLAEVYKVPFWDTQKDGSSSRDCGGMELEICDIAAEIDFLINVPVMKGHCQTKITCALKNLKGLLPNKEKRRFHALGLHKPIAHLNLGLRQDFVVVDNICGDWDFEDGGNPVIMNRIAAAADPVLCDAWVCREMGYEPEEVPYIMMAEALGVGSADLSRLIIHSCNSPEVMLQRPRIRKVVEVQDAVEEVESCSACYGYLIPALDRLRQEGLLDKLGEKISIGQGFRGKAGVLGVGSCTGQFDCSLSGCPPMPDEIYDFLKDYILYQKVHVFS